MHFRVQENIAASQTYLPASRPDMSLPLICVTGAAVKSADNELLTASVPPSEGIPTPQSEQPTPTDHAPPSFIPRAKLSDDFSPEAKPAATISRPSDSFESKLAPAPVSESDLIQPVKKGYINKKNPDFKLANIMRGSFETNESKDGRKSVEFEAKDSTEASKASAVLRSELLKISCFMMLLLLYLLYISPCNLANLNTFIKTVFLMNGYYHQVFSVLVFPYEG